MRSFFPSVAPNPKPQPSISFGSDALHQSIEYDRASSGHIKVPYLFLCNTSPSPYPPQTWAITTIDISHFQIPLCLPASNSELWHRIVMDEMGPKFELALCIHDLIMYSFEHLSPVMSISSLLALSLPLVLHHCSVRCEDEVDEINLPNARKKSL